MLIEKQSPNLADACTSPLKVKSTRFKVAEAEPEPKKEEKESDKVEEEKPQFPTFENELKSIREGIAKEYEEKMKMGIEELDELKKDMASR